MEPRSDSTGRSREALRHAIGGGPEHHRDRHLARGKMPVRERIDRLLDPGAAFLELSPCAAHEMYDGAVPSAGVVTGIGIVSGVPCVLIANDATVKGGSFYAETVAKHARAQEIAEENGLPCLYLVDCGGAYLPEQDRVFPGRDHFGGAFWRQCRMSAQGLPQIAAVFGPATAGGAYIPALADQVVMVRGTGRIHLGGPPIVKAAVAEVVDGETLGGAEMHGTVSGVSDHTAETEAEALGVLRRLMADLSDRFGVAPPPRPPRPPRAEDGRPSDHAPVDLRRPIDMRALLRSVIDDGALSEFKPDWGATLICGFAHIHGYPVGILANDGALFSESSAKGAHFIALCDQRKVPLLFVQNISGFMVGTEAERGGIAKHSAKLVQAVSNARVPKYTILAGGSYGAGNYGMCGRGFRPRFLFAWPDSRIATMSPEVAATVVTDLARSASKDEDVIAKIDRDTRAQFEAQSDPLYATARLWDDGIIEPDQTRDVLGLCLALGASARPEAEPRTVYRM